ncbi:MAG: hypothetical protein K2Q09_05485, partial [Phycisphaerales bacterium]|nr:hypothetical protein [Phycisphaerales bacterium]
MQHDPSSLRNPRSPKPAGAAASAAPAPNPPRADGPVLARQRQSIRLLQAAVADAAARRKGLDAELDEQTTAARRSRDRDLKRAADQLAEARGGAEQEYAATTSGARETFDTAMRQAEASRTRDRDVARERAKRDADQSKQQRDEAVWFAETCLETDRTKIRAQRQIDQIQLGQMRGRLQQARLAADALLTQWRQGVTLQPVARPADAQDPVKAFDAAMESAERQIGDMQRYALPRVIGGLTPWLLVLVLAVCAAVAPSALRGWKVDLVNVYALLGGAVVG